MNGKGDGSDFLNVAEPIIRKLIENIESPFVWMPLGLFILCVLAYPLTKIKVFPYLSIAFLLIAFGADWVGRWQNRQTPPEPIPQTSSYRDEVFKYLANVQAKAVRMLQAGKAEASRALTNKNLQAVDAALKSFPDDADFHALMGYTLKDIYQSSKTLLSQEQRRAYLNQGRKSFEKALQLDPRNASAHNGMGNVLFFEGQFDEAIKEHDKALQLRNGNYPAAKHDKRLVTAVKNGEIPFDF
jgi:tetratricopeptide (TPR) repeat protein